MQYLTKIQQEALKKPCPHCEIGKLREVESYDGEPNEDGDIENVLWCNNCDLSMDGSGGYTH